MTPWPALHALVTDHHYECVDCGRRIPADRGTICPRCGTNIAFAFDNEDRWGIDRRGGER